MWKDKIIDLITGSPTSSLLATQYLNNHASPTFFCSYLDIHLLTHRVTLTWAITGTHDLAIKRGKWVGLTCQWHLCRMCHDDIEDVIHVLFMCTQKTSCKWWDLFLNVIHTGYPALLGSWSPEVLLHQLIENKDLVELTTYFVYDMFNLWKSVPLYWFAFTFNLLVLSVWTFVDFSSTKFLHQVCYHLPIAEAMREYSQGGLYQSGRAWVRFGPVAG